MREQNKTHNLFFDFNHFQISEILIDVEILAKVIFMSWAVQWHLEVIHEGGPRFFREFLNPLAPVSALSTTMAITLWQICLAPYRAEVLYRLEGYVSWLFYGYFVKVGLFH